jgi:hypothetical protein
MADDFPGPYYRLCTNADTCPEAYAYWQNPHIIIGERVDVPHYHFLGSPSAPASQPERDYECRADRWKGTPTFQGPHDHHFFTYGPGGMYTGHCAGRE